MFRIWSPPATNTTIAAPRKLAAKAKRSLLVFLLVLAAIIAALPATLLLPFISSLLLVLLVLLLLLWPRLPWPWVSICALGSACSQGVEKKRYQAGVCFSTPRGEAGGGARKMISDLRQKLGFTDFAYLSARAVARASTLGSSG